MLDKKLQLKQGESIAVVGAAAPGLDLETKPVDIQAADAILDFVTLEADFMRELPHLQTAAKASKLTWVAYPKAKQLSTDLNRDIIRSIANDNGLDPVRQISIDDVWSALRLKAL